MDIVNVKVKDLLLSYSIFNSECLSFLKSSKENSIDSLITDPPAGISFMGKDWDKDKGGRDQWIEWMSEIMTECLSVMKPGAHGLVWAIPRTSHWTATALENAGFEIRDVITHLFGSGFPKSLNISKAIDKAAGVEREVIGTKLEHNIKGSGINSRLHNSSGNRETIEIPVTVPSTPEAKQWDGFGTALKPASEHWILVRKPISEKTVAKNVLKWGTGGINIDECRIGYQSELDKNKSGRPGHEGKKSTAKLFSKKPHMHGKQNPQGRFPANLVLDEQAAEMLDEQSGFSKGGNRKQQVKKFRGHGVGENIINGKITAPVDYSDSGGASRFFYIAKASKKDRGEGNDHPTVKSTKLMEYLIKLITPPDGVVFDPFMGSGSTGVAAKSLGFGFVGIEADKDYFEIAERRLGKLAKRITKRVKTQKG